MLGVALAWVTVLVARSSLLAPGSSVSFDVWTAVALAATVVAILGALDEALRDVVLSELVAQAHRGAAVIIASGDAEVTARCDRVVELQPSAVA